ncbi:hypothetical protein SBI67_11830 [Mycolicibacterium sp. 120266]|nr:hypothetical protein [Mycolicibacterium sp. 120266]MDX1872815.1 hypothetical protein [Mycolicibacterium sp. 120266]
MTARTSRPDDTDRLDVLSQRAMAGLAVPGTRMPARCAVEAK